MTAARIDTLEIRTLTPADARAWWETRFEALETEPFAFGGDLEDHRNLSVETVATRFREASTGYFTLGAFDQGRLIGTATFMRAKGPKEKHKGHVYGVFVTAAERGKGIGRALIGQLLSQAKQDSTLEQIQLAVATCQQAARQLYGSFGFESYGIEPRALKIGATYIDEDHMVLRLR